MNENIAFKLRPKLLSEVIGQRHLIGEGKILSNLVKNKKLYSMIVYGLPGIGKTTLALALVNELGCKYRLLNAAVNNKRDFDVVLEETKIYGQMVLLVDEIHRMNKDKQDILLSAVESGIIILIGMTTENPYHSINPAIRSRCQIFELKPLEKADLELGIKKVCEYLDNIEVTSDAVELLINSSNGDLRFIYNLIEMAYYSTNEKILTKEIISSINYRPAMIGDKNGSGHYNLISALQKSIRGSDVNASLYYLARLLTLGDLEIIFRRLTVIAYEDIGLANPSIGVKVDACYNNCMRLGLPEARIPLGTLVVEMAWSPKSNSCYNAINAALNDVALNYNNDIPPHLKEGSKDYKYPHNYKNNYVAQEYMPKDMLNRKYYVPNLSNKYEANLNMGHDNIIKASRD